MKKELYELTTERRNPTSMDLDQKNTLDILQTINEEDQKVAFAVKETLPQIEIAVDKISHALMNGGRLFYVGAGTSGRLGVLDASECPPTFMTSPDLVQTVMAGGKDAFFTAVEGVEDKETQGEKDLEAHNISERDVVVGITASGRTPYPIGALKYANALGAETISLACNENSLISQYSNCPIEVVVGPEVLTGSTRMKAATAHKMVLNMLTTTSMVKLGKVHENLMVDVHASNYKLKERAKRTVMEATQISYDEAENILKETKYKVKPALVMIKAHVNYQKATQAIDETSGYVQDAIDFCKE